MPVVFVHGVRTRPGKAWERQGKLRRSLFQRFALRDLVPDPAAVSYSEPLWGELGARPRWNHASLPSGDFEKFAVGDPDPAAVMGVVDAIFDPTPGAASSKQLLERVQQSVREERPLGERQPLEELADVLWVVAAGDAPDAQLDALASFSVRAVDYARHEPSPDWLETVEDDAELITTFLEEVEDWPLQGAEPDGGRSAAVAVEQFGVAEIRDRIREAAGRVGGVAGRLTGRALTAALRAPAHKASAIFLGDVLVYLNERGDAGQPGPIVGKVADAVEEAHARIDPPRDPRLVVIGHSMGGNILYDLLTHFRPDLEVDVLVTVGSQVALFEELKQFRVSDDAVPRDPSKDRVPRPSNVGRWINIFDANDMLGFAAGGVFGEVEDFRYSTGAGALRAHGSYLLLPSFHERLGERLRERWG